MDLKEYYITLRHVYKGDDHRTLTFQGMVYPDITLGGKILSYYEIPESLTADIMGILDGNLYATDSYLPNYTCRQWSRDMFELVTGVLQEKGIGSFTQPSVTHSKSNTSNSLFKGIISAPSTTTQKAFLPTTTTLENR